MELLTDFVRAHQVRALLEQTAIVRLVDAMDTMIAQAAAGGDALSEHCAISWQRRRDALLSEYAQLSA